jgi:hypothetical protein
MQKETSSSQRVPLPSAGSERLLHAVALLVARRQMKARWSSISPKFAPRAQLTPLSY